MTIKLFNRVFVFCTLPCPDIKLQKKQLTDGKIKTGDFQEQGRGVLYITPPIRDVVGYEGLYKVTEDGRVWNVRKQRFVAQTNNGNGRLKVELWKNGKRKNIKVHKVVALAFIPNPHDKPQVNHLDGDKLNNHASNLEWATAQENTYHAIEMELMWFQKGEYA